MALFPDFYLISEIQWPEQPILGNPLKVEANRGRCASPLPDYFELESLFLIENIFK